MDAYTIQPVGPTVGPTIGPTVGRTPANVTINVLLRPQLFINQKQTIKISKPKSRDANFTMSGDDYIMMSAAAAVSIILNRRIIRRLQHNRQCWSRLTGVVTTPEHGKRDGEFRR